MKTLAIAFTKGDRCTQPGGIIIRQHDTSLQYMVHHFNRDYGSREPREFFWGHYCETFDSALKAYQEKLRRVAHDIIDDIEILTEVKP